MVDIVSAYEKVVAAHPAVERKGKATPYTSMNGNMFSFITKEGNLALRLPEDVHAALIKKGAVPCFQYGKRMRGYLEMPESIVGNARALKKQFAASVAYAETLKPKATTRKKTAKKAAKKKTARKKTAKKKTAKKR